MTVFTHKDLKTRLYPLPDKQLKFFDSQYNISNNYRYRKSCFEFATQDF